MNSIVFLDIAVVTILLVLAYLSKRLGEALKTPPYYRLFYVGAVLVMVAALINTIFAINFPVHVYTFTNMMLMALRFFCSIAAVFTCMQYWKWLFSEFFKG
jgi:hypothetical protein